MNPFDGSLLVVTVGFCSSSSPNGLLRWKPSSGTHHSSSCDSLDRVLIAGPLVSLKTFALSSTVSHFVSLFVLFYQSFCFRLTRELSVRFLAGKENLIMAPSPTSTLFVDFLN
jgi:hypothetical protein